MFIWPMLFFCGKGYPAFSVLWNRFIFSSREIGQTLLENLGPELKR